MNVMRLGYYLYFNMRFDFIANILFPPICLACRAQIARGVICNVCFSSIALRDGFLCGACHAPIELGMAKIDAIANLMSDCHPDFPYMLGAAADYADKTVQSLIHHLKFRLIPDAAEPLADLVVRYLRQSNTIDFSAAGFIAIPIPLSPQRLRTRGYNQAELIAQRVARSLGIPVVANVLVRAKHTKPQSDTTSEAERRENIRGVYAVRDSAEARTPINGANILLLDDVSTSGATFLEASQVLKAAGVKKIVAVSVAKT